MKLTPELEARYRTAAGSSYLTEAEYQRWRATLDAFEAWVDSRRNKKNGWASYKPEEVPAHLQDVTNGIRAAVELYEFCHNPPNKYFLYVEELGSGWKATGWTGLLLGSVSHGPAYRDNFGGTRVSITVFGVNGVNYHGTYFKSSGNYARVKAFKGSKI